MYVFSVVLFGKSFETNQPTHCRTGSVFFVCNLCTVQPFTLNVKRDLQRVFEAKMVFGGSTKWILVGENKLKMIFCYLKVRSHLECKSTPQVRYLSSHQQVKQMKLVAALKKSSDFHTNGCCCCCCFCTTNDFRVSFQPQMVMI